MESASGERLAFFLQKFYRRFPQSLPFLLYFIPALSLPVNSDDAPGGQRTLGFAFRSMLEVSNSSEHPVVAWSL